MKTQHTWTVSKHAVPEGIYQAGIYTEDGREVATVKSSESDAQLMAAAPQLLAMLQRLLGTCELNLDEMEPETRAAVADASALCAQFE